MTAARRIVSILFELLIPGAGSYTMGDRRRSGLVFGGSALAGGVAAGFAAVGSSTGMWAGVAIGCAARLFGLLVCFRSPRLDPPPTRELALVLVAGAACVFAVGTILKSNVVEAFAVPSGSMYPAITAGDRVMVSKLSRPNERGDIIAFHTPDAPANTLLKRIVGLPGDRIEFQGDKVILNGSPLEQQPVKLPCRAADAGCDLFEERAGQRRYQVAISRDPPEPPSPALFDVPIGHVFVLGDNRHSSLDSRRFGPVPVENLVGRYVFTWWRRGP